MLKKISFRESFQLSDFLLSFCVCVCVCVCVCFFFFFFSQNGRNKSYLQSSPAAIGKFLANEWTTTKICLQSRLEAAKQKQLTETESSLCQVSDIAGDWRWPHDGTWMSLWICSQPKTAHAREINGEESPSLSARAPFFFLVRGSIK